MLKSIASLLSIIFLLAVSVQARTKHVRKDISSLSSKGERPEPSYKVHNIGRVWSAVSNMGTYGDPFSEFPSYDWPGGTGAYYLWYGGLWIGVDYYVSHADYANEEFYPSEDGRWWINREPKTSVYDIECKYDDWYDNWNFSDRQLGLKVAQKAMAWSVEGFEDFLIYQYKITYVADSSFRKRDTLKGVYISWVFDADCGGRVSPNAHIDDLVGYDGWVNNEWETAYHPYSHVTHAYPYDEVTLHSDGTIDLVPDGTLDQITVFGDESDEVTLHGDTLYLWRNISYMYDGDNLGRPGDDAGESGMVPGYIGGTVLYAPPSPNDSIWVDAYGDTCRMIRPMSHQWWNWSNDPWGDEEKYLYMIGMHEFSRGHRFMPHPFDWGSTEFDYRFMHTFGPYEIADGDTLELVFAGLMGFGLNGGYGYDKGVEEGMFKKYEWYPGMRYTADQALKAYYLGSEFSDPVHPSSPSEDIHWLIRIPPEVPLLEYSAGKGAVILAWTDIAEITPDPIDEIYDFAGYRIYRSEFKVGEWYLVKGFVDSAFASEHPDSFPVDIYEWMGEGETFPHSYVDANIIYGIPYFYILTAFDIGRPPLTPSLESKKINYKQTEAGISVPIIAKTKKLEEPLTVNKLDKVTVTPNPYLGSAQWERQDEDRIQFMNLPGSCRIRIYTASGDLVKEIEHTDGTGDAYWDLLSRGELPVASGLYVYKIEARDDKNKPIHKIGKVIIIR